jgi:sulfate/thiosulfate transport system substrate-binding protein
VSALYRNVAVLDTGARAAMTTFAERGMGDALVTWENEALRAIDKLAGQRFDVVVPSVAVVAEPPVAIVDRIVDKKGTRRLAEAYVSFLYAPEAQKIAASHFYRVGNLEMIAGRTGNVPDTSLVTVEGLFGSWNAAHDKHFATGAMFDQIYRIRAGR